MKCLEKDRTRRYETANGLALDIQRHLHDEAVRRLATGTVLQAAKTGTAEQTGVYGGHLRVVGAGAGVSSEPVASRAGRTRSGSGDSGAGRPTGCCAVHRRGRPRVLAAQEKFDEAIKQAGIRCKASSWMRPSTCWPRPTCWKRHLRLADAAAVYCAAPKLNPDHARAKENGSCATSSLPRPKAPKESSAGKASAC